jgi:Brp/Blh family beta-carotene 15,15'-monooxygenase
MKIKILIGGILLSIGHLLLDFTPLQQTFMLFVGVVIIGIPHGSIDHYLYMINNKLNGSFIHFIKFLIQYLGIGLIYALLWWLNPLIALFIFIGISAFHFGELDTLNFDFKNKKYAYLVALTYGSLFLLNLLLFNTKDVLPIINSFPGISLTSSEMLQSSDLWIPIFPIISSIVFFVILLISLEKSAYFSKKTSTNLLYLLFLLFLVFSMPLILGFAFYFCAWHSTLSFNSILKHLEWQTKSPVFVLKKLVPTNIAAWLFLGSLMFYFKSDLNRLTAILFLGIAVLTAPHIGVISKMLQSQKQV